MILLSILSFPSKRIISDFNLIVFRTGMTAVSSAALLAALFDHPYKTKCCEKKQRNRKCGFNRNASFLFFGYLWYRCSFRFCQVFIFIRIVFTHRNRLFLSFFYKMIFPHEGVRERERASAPKITLFVPVI